MREVRVIGQFAPELAGSSGCLPAELAEDEEIDEIHVHLLAETDAEVARVMTDLAAALFPRPKRTTAAVISEGQAQLAKWFPSLRGMFHAFG